jgi:flagellar biosynthesis/type III secretory pathway protein FliH
MAVSEIWVDGDEVFILRSHGESQRVTPDSVTVSFSTEGRGAQWFSEYDEKLTDGAYQEGYNEGYATAESEALAVYDEGYDNCYEDGFTEGSAVQDEAAE